MTSLLYVHVSINCPLRSTRSKHQQIKAFRIDRTDRLPYDAGAAQFVRSYAVVVAERAALLAHDHRLEAAGARGRRRRRRLLGLRRLLLGRRRRLLRGRLGAVRGRLHGGAGMVTDHHVLVAAAAADQRGVLVHRRLDGDVAVDHARRHPLAAGDGLRARVRALDDEIVRRLALHLDKGGILAIK